MKNIFRLKCPHCEQEITIYVVDKTDEVNGIKIDKVIYEEPPKDKEMREMQGRRLLRVECHKDKDTIYLCEPRKRKRYSIFPKWWCYKCGRYILPDKFHKPVWITADENGEFSRSYKSFSERG